MTPIQHASRLFRRNRKSIGLAARNAVVVSAGLAAAKLLGFAYATLLARVAGAGTFGEFTLFVTIFILISEIPAAFDVIYIRFANAPDTKGSADHYLKIGLIAKAGYLFAVVVGGWLAAPQLAGLLDKPDSVLLIQYAITGGGVYCLYLMLISTFQRQHRFFWVSALRVLFPLAVLVSIVTLVIFLEDRINSTDIAVVFSGVACFFGVAALAVMVARIHRSTRVSGGAVLKFYQAGGVLLVAAAIGIVSRRLDVFFLSSNLEFSDLGQYGVALRVSVLVSFLTAAITTILVPKAVSAMHDRLKFRRYLGLAAFYGVFQTVVAIAVIYFMGPIVMLLFGESYSAAVSVGIILIVQVLLMSYGVPFKALVQAGPYPSYMIGTSLLRLITGLILLGWWVPEFGLIGAAVAVTATEGLITVVLIGAALASRRTVSVSKSAEM